MLLFFKKEDFLSTAGPRSGAGFISFQAGHIVFRTILTFLWVASVATAATSARAEDTLSRIQHSNRLRCGNIAEQTDFDKRDTHGNVGRLGNDMCHALAAAVLGGSTGLVQQGYPDGPHGLEALRTGKIDVLYGVSPHADWAWHYAAAYGQPIFYDGQSLLVHQAAGIKSLQDLAGHQVCFIGNTEAERSVTRALRQRHIDFKPFPFEETGEMEAALVDGHCQAEANDVSALAEGRTGFHARQLAYVILPDRLTLDPYVPALPANDTAWARAVDAVTFALIEAEIEGVTQANVAARAAAPDAQARGLLRRRGGGFVFGLPDGWATAAIGAVGNYGEMFERDLGAKSAMRMPRGVNVPWSEGGMLWAPPFE